MGFWTVCHFLPICVLFILNMIPGVIPARHPNLLLLLFPLMISRLHQAIVSTSIVSTLRVNSSVAGFGYYYVPALTALCEESKSLSDEMWDTWVSRKRDAYTTLQIACPRTRSSWPSCDEICSMRDYATIGLIAM